jgi:hypothetical protein
LKRLARLLEFVLCDLAAGEPPPENIQGLVIARGPGEGPKRKTPPKR